MSRTLIAVFACFAVALLGISGVHAHLPGAGHATGDEVHAASGESHHSAHVISVLEHQHAADHDDDGDIDVDPLVKAFGKISLSAPVALVAFWFGIVLLAAREITSVFTWAPPLRPPCDRARFFVLPPSQAPPSLLV